MFSSVKIIILSLVLLISCQTLAATQDLPLIEIKQEQNKIYSILQKDNLSNLQKLTAATEAKFLIEESLKNLITDKTVNPADLANPESELAQAFEGLDFLTIISQLEKDEAGKISNASCGEAQAMLTLSLADPTGDELRLPTDNEKKALHILQSLCR